MTAAMKEVKNILLLLIALLALGCSQTIIFEDSQTPKPTPTPKPEPTPEDKQLTSAPYTVGDYYCDGEKEGVVFDVWDNGNSGKILSMTQSANGLQWSSDEAEQKRFLGAESYTDGAANTAKIKAISGWQNKYPAFKWCADLGSEWYLPAKEELELFTLDNTVHNAVNNTLLAKGCTKIYDEGTGECYWSSTDINYQVSSGIYCAWYVYMRDGSSRSSEKSVTNYVRSVTTFGNVPKPEPEPEPEPEDKQFTSAPYSVGDYYYDGTKEGVVFEIWDNGNSGKIVSMKQADLQWSSDSAEQKRLIGADSETDGAYNMAKVKAIPDWETKYPTFKWCADLGEGWYLPSKEELLIIFKNKDKLNSNLTDKLSINWHWSSTEYDEQYNGYFCAWIVHMYYGNTLYSNKSNDYYVRAVSAFGNTQQPEPEPEPEPEDKQFTSAPYAVGDYYNDGTKEGVVFDVWDNGNSGKIVSMTKSASTIQWASDLTEQNRLIGANSEADGAVNMAVVKAISGWETKYPAFKWCADLGSEWYLPAKEELLTIYNGKDKLNTRLTDELLSESCWSSTECDQLTSGEYCAWGVSMYNSSTESTYKRYYKSVRAVTTFGDVPKPKPEPEQTEPANNEIWYTSTDGKVVTPAQTAYFNVSITSNTYKDGKGVITFSGPLTTIGRNEGEEPFLNCDNLKSVVLPNSVTTIGYGAFALCAGLENIDIPNSVSTIKDSAFYDCDKLATIALPYNLLRIGKSAFASCDSITSVTIPDSVTRIGEGAFSGEKLRAFYGKYASSDNKLIIFDKTVICAALGELTEYSIPNTVEKIGFSAFGGYRNIKRFTIPNSVMSIGDGSFNSCTSLQDITIPDSVTEIVGGSFYNCTSLTSAILSKNLTKIGDATFMNCASLKTVFCNAVTPPQCGKGLFDGVPSGFKIYVLAASVSAYKSATNWSIYADAIVADPSTFTSAPYSVGDCYNDGTKDGVVFEIWDNGNSGKIVSMTQSTSGLQWSSDEIEQDRLISADSETDGAYNTAKVKAVSGWESKYPAFKWCADLGEDWYLPSKEEMLTIHYNKDKLDPKLTDKLSYVYWSSTEEDSPFAFGESCAWYVNMYYGSATYNRKYYDYYVRAVTTFGNVPKPEPDLDYSTATDLSAEDTANCYLVKVVGKYKFKAVKGNSAQSVGAASSADVLWESFGTSTTPNVGDLIASAIYKDGYVYFATPKTFKSGNASIAVRDSSGTILWSWHIWCSAEGWTDDIYPNNAGTMMDRNLGATSATPGSVGALGLMYQWGRKDPFLGSSSISSNTLAVSTGSWNSVSTQQTVEYATEYPMTFIDVINDWCMGDGSGDTNYAKRWKYSYKTMYDPCPVGYRVPDGGALGLWQTALTTTTWDSVNSGILWELADGNVAWYPAAGCRHGMLMYVGSSGYYWSASGELLSSTSSNSAYSMEFIKSYVYPKRPYAREYGQSVRCVRE